MAETQETAGKSAVIERLSWQVAQRDDARVAQAVQQGEELDAVYELSEAGLLDGFFHFLEITGVRELIGQLTVSQVKRVPSNCLSGCEQVGCGLAPSSEKPNGSPSIA